MAIYMPPLTHKKQVLERYNPDTFRVISHNAEQTHQKIDHQPSNKPSEWRKQWLDNNGLALPDIHNKKTEVLPREAPDYRMHKPHPGSCGFLRNNVRWLNEPICSVYTEVTKDEQKDWWPSRVSNEPLHVPPKSKDTIYRTDYEERENTSSAFGSQRHTANPNKEPALGTVPVNFLRTRDDKQRFYKEKISYEHQYNSRVEPSYPIRAKRHGTFVWDQMSDESSKKFVDHYTRISAEEGLIRQQEEEAQNRAYDPYSMTTDMFEMLEVPSPKMPSPKMPSPPPQSAKGSPKTSKPSSPKQSAKTSPKNSAPSSPKQTGSRKSSGAGDQTQSVSTTVEADAGKVTEPTTTEQIKCTEEADK